MESENLENIDLEYYNKEGEFLNEFYRLEDFLNCKETKQILEEEHYNNFEKNVEPKLINFLKYFKEYYNETSLFKETKGHAEGEFVALIYNNLNKNYDLNIFYENPELAQSLLKLDK